MDLTVTPADVALYAPQAPAVMDNQVAQALDWAEPLLERHHVTLTRGTRQAREAARAVSAYAIALALGGVRTQAVAGAAAIQKFKDGDSEIVYAERDTTALAALPGNWVSRAWQHLYAAGVPRSVRVAGASR